MQVGLCNFYHPSFR